MERAAVLLRHMTGQGEQPGGAGDAGMEVREETCSGDSGVRALIYGRKGQQGGGCGAIELQRPAAMHSLSQAMIRFLFDTLQRWRTDGRVGLVVIFPQHVRALPGEENASAGKRRRRAFCAGGDLKEFISSDIPAFTYAEYRMDIVLHTYPKPVVALIDGVVMGGGAGISILASHRVLTPHSFFAMPEAKIGWVTDCGAGYFLSSPRVEGRHGEGVPGLGKLLALTGSRCGPEDMMLAHLADWYSEADVATGGLLQDLLGLSLGDGCRGKDAHARVSECIGTWCTKGREVDVKKSKFWPHRAAISSTFADATDVEVVLARLESLETEWGQATTEAIEKQCPTSLKVIMELLVRCADQPMPQCMQLEYRGGVQLAPRHDLQEGVAAVLVRKDNNPVFSPARVRDVDTASVRRWFAPMDGDLLQEPIAGVAC